MRIESIESLIDWTKEVHFELAKALASGLKDQTEERARELLQYLQQQETHVAKIVSSYEDRADLKALHTMVYDYEAHTPVETARIGGKPYGSMAYDAIAKDVLNAHNEIIELYRYLIGRSAISEEQVLLEALLEVEEHETMQLSQQINRGRDM
ncbi:MAG: hypothetical protein ABR612_11540 [Chromatocurvus sp.]